MDVFEKEEIYLMSICTAGHTESFAVHGKRRNVNDDGFN
jgi:hypothetical protein